MGRQHRRRWHSQVLGPHSVSDLMAYWRAADLDIADGANPTPWNPRTDNTGNSLQLIDTGANASYDTTTFPVPGVDFTSSAGLDDLLNDTFPLQPTAAQSVIVAFTYQCTDVTDASIFSVVGSGDDSGDLSTTNATFHGYDFEQTTGGVLRFRMRGTDDSRTEASTPVGLVNNTPYVIIGVRDTADNAQHIWVNGLQHNSTTNATSVQHGSRIGQMNMGTLMNGSTTWSPPAVISDWICYVRTGAITNAEINRLAKWLANRIGVTWTDVVHLASGKTVLDYGSGGNNGTMTNMMATAYTPIDRDQRSLSFDGTDDEVTIPDNADHTFGDGSTDSAFSISAWIKIDVGSQTHGIVTRYDDATDREFLFWIDASDRLNIACYDESANAHRGRKDTTGGITVGEWTHVCMTYNGNGATTGFKLYENAVQVDNDNWSSGTYTAMEDRDITTRIGNAGLANYDLEGSMDDVRLYSRELSAAQVTALYNHDQTNGDFPHDPVGHWPFQKSDEGTTTATDLGSGSNNGTLANGPVYSGDVPAVIADPQGVPNKERSMKFDGTDDYVDIAAAVVTAEPFSVSAWVKRTSSAAGTDTIVWIGDNSVTNKYHVLAITDTVAQIQTRDSGGTASADSTTNITDGQWHHIVGVWTSASSRTIYLDGGSSATDSTTKTAPTINAGAIGRNNDSTPDGYLAGNANDIRIYDRALTAAEVTALYTDVSPPTDAVGHWKITADDQGGGTTTVTDSGSGGNNGTMTNGPLYSHDVPSVLSDPIGTYSMKFDGTDDYVDCGTGAALDITGSISIAFWMKRTTGAVPAANEALVARNHVSSAANTQYAIHIKTDRILHWQTSDGSNEDTTNSATAMDDTEWHHIVATWSTTKQVIYIDGVEDANESTANTSIQSVAAGKFGFGAEAQSPEFYFNGQMGDVKVFSRELTAAEVTALFKGTETADNFPLDDVGHWSFDHGVQ